MSPAVPCLMEHTLYSLTLFTTAYFFFLAVAARIAGKEKQQFNNQSVKVSLKGNHELPAITMQVDLLGIEITT